MAYRIGEPTQQQFIDDNGDPANGHVLYFYIAGTTTPTNVAFDPAGAAEATTVTIGADGFPASGGSPVTVYYDEDTTYDIVRKDSGGTAYGPTIEDYNVTQDVGDAAIGVLSDGSSGVNAIVANLSPSPGSLTDQLQVIVELQHGANTITNPTFNLNSLGAKTIVRDSDKPLRPGDLAGSGFKAYFNYSAAKDAWILLNPANASLGQGAAWYEGLKITNNATDAVSDIDIAAGATMDSTEAMTISLTSALTKQINAAWAEGSSAGGLPLGADSGAGIPLANQWYRVFLIAKDTGSVDGGFDITSTAANLLADATDYTYYKRIGYVFAQASGTVFNFIDSPAMVYRWNNNISAGISLSTASGTLVGVRVPPNMDGEFIYNIDNTVGNPTAFGLLTQADQTDKTPDSNDFQVVANTTDQDTAIVRMKTNSSSQIRHRESGGSGSTSPTLLTVGWYDDLTEA